MNPHAGEPPTSTRGISGIDHVLIAAPVVDQARDEYERLGFQVLAGGEHPGLGTYNALIPLADGAYLELIGVRDRARAERFPATGHVLEALEREERLADFVLEARDIDETVHGIRSRGLDIEQPVPGERLRPDGTRVAWRAAVWRKRPLPFLIEDVTPRPARIPEPERGVGRELTLSGVVCRVADLSAAVEEWSAFLGVRPEGSRFRLGRGSVRLEPVAGGRPALAAVELASRDPARAASSLPGEWLSDGRFALDRRRTAGASLFLVSSSAP